MDQIYSFILRGELTKVALSSTEARSRHYSSDIIINDYIKSLSLDLMDDEYVNAAKLMATVYTAIAAFENMVRKFVEKILIEKKGKIGGKNLFRKKFAKKLNRGKNKRIELDGILKEEIL